ncbi:hypothetical protein [uncultured Clostridium sp.]|uniref:hypothetical protein n=1 Tax=uncultured Clostridium sp. TaxID=59620 RepID=UPI0025D43E58|nr:hypothetical protein [uncultured Clostridium sp.]
MKRNHIKNNLIYYWSVLDVFLTGLSGYIIHFIKTGKLPKKRTKYSQNEILDELRKIAEETDMQ